MGFYYYNLFQAKNEGSNGIITFLYRIDDNNFLALYMSVHSLISQSEIVLGSVDTWILSAKEYDRLWVHQSVQFDILLW